MATTRSEKYLKINSDKKHDEKQWYLFSLYPFYIDIFIISSLKTPEACVNEDGVISKIR